MKNNLLFEKMSQSEALEIANNWKYPYPYNFYDMTEDLEDYEELISVTQRGNNFFSIKEKNILIGFFSIYPFKNNNKEIEFGIGLRPDLTGKGNGKYYTEAALDYIERTFKPRKIWLSVADFNERAIKVYEKIGFKEEYTKRQKSNGSEYNFVVMSKSNGE
ncbi:hypothetical protein A5881_003614 [Enterococcus termitis]